MSHILAFEEAFWAVVHPSGTLRGHLEPYLEPSLSRLCTCRVQGLGSHLRGEAAHSPLTPLGENYTLLFSRWLLTPDSILRTAQGPTAMMLYYDWASHWPKGTPFLILQRCCRWSLFTVRSTGSESQQPWFSKSPEMRRVFAWGQHWEIREDGQWESVSTMARMRRGRREKVIGISGGFRSPIYGLSIHSISKGLCNENLGG